MFVCNREKNAEKRAAPLLTAWKNLSEDEKNALLPTLGARRRKRDPQTGRGGDGRCRPRPP